MKRVVVLIGLSFAWLMSSCEPEKKELEVESEYLVTNPLRKDTLITKDYVCQIHSIQHIELRALERGYLENVFVDEGKSVRKGQRLFQIMPLIYQAEKQKAQAEVNFAETEYKNTKRLTDSGVVSPNELALAKAKLDKAKAELSLAQVHLDFTEIKAPFDGIINKFLVRKGSLLDEGELLTSLSDNSKMWVYFNVPEAEYLDYQSNLKGDSAMTVRLLMANNKLFKFAGVVETIEADFNNETGNIAFRATFPNPKGLLRHGETGSVIAKTPYKDALLIPQKTTFEVLDKKYVYVIDEHNVVKSRAIKIAAELPHLYVVEDGLEEGDRILLEGLRKVRENEKIKVKMVDPKIALSQLNLYAE